MKVIRQLDGPTQGLLDYLSQEKGDPTFRKFQDYDDGNAYRELRDALRQVQHGICGYCEINLMDNDCQVEHYIPQSAGEEGRRKAVDSSNMIACCKGGDQTNLFGPDTKIPDPERYLPPTKDSRSCDATKGDSTAPDLIDPRALAASPSLFRVNVDGRMVPDENACAGLGIPVAQVNRTIEILGLNVRRLRANRAAKWESLIEVWGDELTDPNKAELAARAELLPNVADILPPYFTTSRSYFGEIGESVLTEEPKSWI